MNENIDSVVKTTAIQLMGIKGSAKRNSYNPKRDRFKMPYSAETIIRNDLNANRIIINGINIAIATQFPFQHQLEAQLQMMVDNRTPALIILASISDMQRNELPDYFSRSGTFGQITTLSTFMNHIDLGNSIEAKVYKLNITGYQTSIDVPVIHIQNWPDHQTVSPETTINLVKLVESTIADKRAFYEARNSRAIYHSEKMLPVIHCRAGVGRTGQTIAAMAMKKYPELSLASITEDLRKSRNNFMIQTPIQMETLVKLDSNK